MTTIQQHQLRRVAPIAFPLLIAVFLFAGCGWFGGPTITVTWAEPKAGIEAGAPVRYQSVQVGEVKKITPAGRGVEVIVELRKKYAHYVRVESTFLVRPAASGQPSFIEVVLLNPDSATAPDGARFQGSESEIAAKAQAWTTDWKRTAIYVGIGLGAVILLIFISKSLLRLWAFIFCLAAGAAASVFLSPFAQGYLAQWIPVDARPDVVAYVASFAVGYLGGTVVISILKAPFRAAS